MYKLYIFVNDFLATKHTTIQTAHLMARLMLNEEDDIQEWALQEEPVIVLLSGKDIIQMDNIRDVFSDVKRTSKDSPYTWDEFVEPMLAYAMTAIGQVIPEKIWHMAGMVRHGEETPQFASPYKTIFPEASMNEVEWHYNQAERELVCLLAEAELHRG